MQGRQAECLYRLFPRVISRIAWIKVGNRTRFLDTQNIANQLEIL